ncbi:hypothetical protein ALO80_200155 [Pseudomonas caricapapayae]|uniref:Uncharacterized protein n=1 Tax=Pseudomonas caricapapayae TaxID=46678 RepID=A0A0P9Q054_9PSED|nr:hypothetical protein [Pseudomonas caricapapayae]KPW63177.1 hypothetical protein ALO80_200155 [Pseudomonas caricapapayae]RMM08025.1 hypothetical protein ALQ84_200279 [Pseudomonas caricapapayae]
METDFFSKERLVLFAIVFGFSVVTSGFLAFDLSSFIGLDFFAAWSLLLTVLISLSLLHFSWYYSRIYRDSSIFFNILPLAIAVIWLGLGGALEQWATEASLISIRSGEHAMSFWGSGFFHFFGFVLIFGLGYFRFWGLILEFLADIPDFFRR